MPRPNVPSTLWSGAIDVAVAIADHAMQTATIPRTARDRMSAGGRGRANRSRATDSHATAVSATSDVSAQAFGSSYGPAASASTAKGTASSTARRPAHTSRDENNLAASAGAVVVGRGA